MGDSLMTTRRQVDRLWIQRFVWLLAGTVAFRVLYLFLATDYQLAGDEVYYWDWGRRLDWGYYSKPPLIGWLMGLIGWLSGDSWQAIRLTSILFGSMTLSFLFILGRMLFGAQAGFYTALLFLLTPANAMLNQAMTIDAPLMLCWSLALVLFWLAVCKPESWLRWVALMLVLGVGTLAKQMMLVFPALMILFLLLAPARRRVLGLPQTWISMIGSLGFLVPTLLWNQRHGWITLKHTSEHFQGKEMTFFDWLSQTASFPLLQAVFYSPVTWVLLLAGLIVAARRWPRLTDAERYLWLFAAPGLAFCVLLALRQHLNENWPAVFYLSGFGLLAHYLVSPAAFASGAESPDSPVASKWLPRALWTGGIMAALLYLAIPVIGWAGLRGHPRLDPVRDMRGWEEAGRLVGEYYAKVSRPEQTFVLVVSHRYNASQMAFWMPQHPRVYRWNRSGIIESQYEIWPNAEHMVGGDAFIIDPLDVSDGYADGILSAYISGAFEKVERLGRVEVDIGNGTKRAFQLWLGSSMKRWPNNDSTPVQRS